MTRLNLALLLAICGFLTGNLNAQADPKAVELGAFQLIPTLAVSAVYDDNILSDDVNEVASYITLVTPGVQLLTELGAATAAITYRGDFGYYEEDADDNYSDHVMSFDYQLIDTSGLVSVTAAIERGHDSRGTGASEGIAFTRSEPDKFKLAGLDALLELGSTDSSFGWGFRYGKGALDYTNNRAETRFRDREDEDFALRLYARIAQKTRLFVERAFKEIEYDETPVIGGSLDSEEDILSLGLTWDITGKTTGEIKFGETDKDFADPLRTDADLNTWSASLSWSPRTYSTFVLTSSRTPQETNGTGDSIESTMTSISWLNRWAERFSTTVHYESGDSSHVGDPRKDDLKGAGLALDYDWQRWLNVRVGVDYNERDSTTNVFDYDRVIYTVAVNLSL